MVVELGLYKCSVLILKGVEVAKFVDFYHKKRPENHTTSTGKMTLFLWARS